MSRPNHAAALGFSRACLSTAWVGSVCVNRPGAIAMTTNSRIRALAIQKKGFFRSSRQASWVSERDPCASWAVVGSAATAMVTSVMADPRVEHAVQQVDEQVDEQVDDDQLGDGADDAEA